MQSRKLERKSFLVVAITVLVLPANILSAAGYRTCLLYNSWFSISSVAVHRLGRALCGCLYLPYSSRTSYFAPTIVGVSRSS
ncbi:MAG: hypothetical protein MPJ25_08385 [Pirellulales bacterium]|nr:hypothetical protein [Pirellulales bacterium]